VQPPSRLELVALLVREYDPAIQFFRDVLQFELVEDSPSVTIDGRPKRWVVVRPPGSETGSFWPVPMASFRLPPLASNSPVALDSSFV
jgi:catechol 2,3-dioxygenase-like lactoylglutathione lyase family enzyme